MILDQQILASFLLFAETNKALKFIILFSQVGGRGKTQIEKRKNLFLMSYRGMKINTSKGVAHHLEQFPLCPPPANQLHHLNEKKKKRKEIKRKGHDCF